MTLDDREHCNRGFMDFLMILGCKSHFKSELHRIHYRKTKTSCV